MKIIASAKFIGGPLDGHSVDLEDNMPLPKLLSVPAMAFNAGNFKYWVGCPESMRHCQTVYMREGITSNYLYAGTTID